MDWLIAIALLVVVAPLLVYAIVSIKKSPRRGGGAGAGFIAFDQVFDPSKRHILEVHEERVLERDTGEPPAPQPDADIPADNTRPMP